MRHCTAKTYPKYLCKFGIYTNCPRRHDWCRMPNYVICMMYTQLKIANQCIELHHRPLKGTSLLPQRLLVRGLSRSWCVCVGVDIVHHHQQLASKENFSTFLQLSCLKFRLKLYDGPYSYKNWKRCQFWRGLGRVRSKTLLSKTIIHKIFEINSSFHVK